MNRQALFSLKDNNKEKKNRLSTATIFLGTLRMKKVVYTVLLEMFIHQPQLRMYTRTGGNNNKRSFSSKLLLILKTKSASQMDRSDLIITASEKDFNLRKCTFPANTQCRHNVAATSRRCSDVVTTLLWRCVFTGFWNVHASASLQCDQNHC